MIWNTYRAFAREMLWGRSILIYFIQDCGPLFASVRLPIIPFLVSFGRVTFSKEIFISNGIVNTFRNLMTFVFRSWSLWATQRFMDQHLFGARFSLARQVHICVDWTELNGVIQVLNLAVKHLSILFEFALQYLNAFLLLNKLILKWANFL